MKSSKVTFVTIGLLGVIVVLASFHSTSGAASNLRFPASDAKSTSVSPEVPATAQIEKNKPGKSVRNSSKNQNTLAR